MRKVTELRLEAHEVLEAVAAYVSEKQKVNISPNDVALSLRIAYKGTGRGAYEAAVCEGARVRLEETK